MNALPRNVARRFVRWVGLLLTVVLCSIGTSSRANAEGEQVKAAFVYNFAKLTTWPSEPSTIVIGIIGRGETGDVIRRVVTGKQVNGHPITVRSITAGEAKTCQIVFVCGAGGPPNTGAAHVLVVGEADGFAANGGAIGLVMSGEHVKFEINLAAAKRAGLQLSSKLTTLGRLVG